MDPPACGQYRAMNSLRDAGLRSDADVIVLSRAAPEVFGIVFDRHFRAVHRFLAARGGAGLADDLAAQTFVVAFERRSTFRASSTPDARPWLLGIANNLLRGSRRSERRHLTAL